MSFFHTKTNNRSNQPNLTGDTEMSDRMTVKVENDNSGCLYVIAVIMLLLLMQIAKINILLKENLEQNPQQPETVQTTEVQDE